MRYFFTKLRDRKSFTVQEFVEKYEVSNRTVKRDIEYVRERLAIDIQCSGGSHPVYTISEEETLSLYRRQADQGLLLLALLDSFSRNQFLFPLDYRQLRDNLNLPLSDQYLDLTEHVSYEMTEEKAIKLDLFHALMASIQDQKQLSIQYSDLKGELTRRRIEACHLRNSDGQWYLLAWCHLRNDLRIFHVSRIRAWGALDIPFTQTMTKAEINHVLDNSFGIMTNRSGAAITVSILFSGKAAKLVEGKRWHEEQSEEFVPGGLKVSFPVESFEEVLRIAFSYHSEAEVLGPPEFRELWVEKIREMSKKFL
ncbi:MAG: hypothetical protein B6241_10600 [Spirochaetaceae bacterium 4572_59]|nr:MAG: hypothetical protein B6241_10600 [Spirochaetaceae bacterium 4572_59]